MTKDEALKLALEALKESQTDNDTMEFWDRKAKAITAIKQARALDKMAENARELGLDYEPWKSSDTAHRPGGLPQDFIKHEVANEGDWSEWVNPNSEQYFMKCCDCGLVHEMQFKVAKYSEGDECEFVTDANLQAVFRARRATPPAQPAPVQEIDWKDQYEKQKRRAEMWIAKYEKDIGPLEYAAPAAQREWVGLTDEEFNDAINYKLTPRCIAIAVEAKLKEKNT
jgi:hypothetical protein